ncbi:MAG: exopolysaccharide biosynthesis protein [Pelagibaca sp.]
MSEPAQTTSVNQIVDRLADLADQDRINVGEIIEAFGTQSFLPILMVPALLVVSPLSGIPLFSSACGIAIAAISVQMVAGRRRLWLPQFLVRRSLEGQRARDAIQRVHGVAGWLDHHSRDRFHPLLRWPGRKLIQTLCLVCGGAMPFLEIVPFSSSVLGSAVLLFATALLLRDGLFAVFGLVMMSSAAAILVTVAGSL